MANAQRSMFLRSHEAPLNRSFLIGSALAPFRQPSASCKGLIHLYRNRADSGTWQLISAETLESARKFQLSIISLGKKRS